MMKRLLLFFALLAVLPIFADSTITYKATKKLPEVTDNNERGIHVNAFSVPIKKHTFKHGEGTITFDGELTEIGQMAFAGSYLTSVTIPKTVTKIGMMAFCACMSLESVSIPDSVSEIGQSAFSTCVSLKSVTIPNSLTRIERDVFGCCSSLTSVNIPAGVTSIGGSAFFKCTSLTSITLPNTIAKMGTGAFSQCPNLTIYVPKGAKDRFAAAAACKGIKIIEL